MNAYLLALVFYSLLLIALGLFLGRRVKTSEDFFVAGRRLGPGLLFSTLLAANIGSGSTVGAAGLGYNLGLSGWWWVGSAGIGSLILAFTVGPRIWRLARDNRFYTVGDFLEFRYSLAVRTVVVGLLWLGTLFILAGQIMAIAAILAVVAATPKVAGCLIGGIVVVIYFAAGGLKGAATINLVQLVVKGAGFLIGVPVALAAVGGWGEMSHQLLQQPERTEAFLKIWGIGGSGIAYYLFLLVPPFIISPGLLQKIYGARDARTVKLGAGANAVALLIFAFLPVLLGMVAALRFPGIQDPDLVLPRVITEILPFWLGALLLASVFSAEISSADAILFMLATSLTRDLYQRFFKRDADEKQLLRISRLTSVAAGTLGVGLAIVLETVIQALSIFYGLMAVALFVPLLAGLYSRRPAARPALAAILISVPATLVFHLLTGGLWYGISSTAFGIAISAIVVFFGLFTKPSRRRLRDYH